jgi:cytochrome c
VKRNFPKVAALRDSGKAAARPLLGLFLVLAAPVSPAAPEGPRLGTPASAEAIAAWNMNVFPDGRGLPPGKGDALAGKTVYERHCAACHGVKGGGGSGGELAGGAHGLKDPNPDKTVGSYWPYATTLFDFTRRAMPLDAPGSLSEDEVYAVSAYLLYLDGIIAERAEMNAMTLPQVKMPNRAGFVRVDAP